LDIGGGAGTGEDSDLEDDWRTLAAALVFAWAGNLGGLAIVGDAAALVILLGGTYLVTRGALTTRRAKTASRSDTGGEPNA
jgi:hypothetical protein